MTVTWPDALFTTTAVGTPTHLRSFDDGRSFPVDVSPWHGAPTAADRDAVARAHGPVLDIGCGPGRHLVAVAEHHGEALGIDVSPSAVRTARRRGGVAIRASVWGPVPRPGHWRTALLLDGNIGIGGDPVALLRRTAELLGPPGRVVVELGWRRHAAGPHLVRVEHRGVAGPWFPWAVVTPAEIAALADAAGYDVDESWDVGGRHFAVLARTAAGRSAQDGRHVAHGARRPA